MFSNISWQEYWTSLVIITLAYYLIIYLVYFRKELTLQLFSRKQILSSVPSGKEESKPAFLQNDNPGSKQTKDNEEHVVYACMDELNAFFENQKKIKAVKSELMYSLYTILQKYPSLRNSEYRATLSNVIATQCENICSIHLSAEELKGVWFG